MRPYAAINVATCYYCKLANESDDMKLSLDVKRGRGIARITADRNVATPRTSACDLGRQLRAREPPTMIRGGNATDVVSNEFTSTLEPCVVRRYVARSS